MHDWNWINMALPQEALQIMGEDEGGQWMQPLPRDESQPIESHDTKPQHFQTVSPLSNLIAIHYPSNNGLVISN
jgi:hypothetical protein